MSRGPASGQQHAALDVEHLLQPGERLLWQGCPDPGVVFARQDLFLIPFSVLWCAFAALWEASAVAARTWVGALFGAPLVAFGLYLVAGRFLYKWRDRRRTRYAVTDQRVLVLRLRRRQVLHAPVGGPMAVLRRRDGRHGSVVWAVLGSPPARRALTFSGGNATMLRGTGWPMPGPTVGQVAFFDVDRFDDLLGVVLRARQALGVSEPPRTLASSGGHPLQSPPYGAYPGAGQPSGGPPTEPAEPARPRPFRPDAPPAGWYPDPDPASTGGERWWDGVGWSFHVRPGPPSGPQPGPDRPPGSEGGAGAAGGGSDEPTDR